MHSCCQEPGILRIRFRIDLHTMRVISHPYVYTTSSAAAAAGQKRARLTERSAARRDYSGLRKASQPRDDCEQNRNGSGEHSKRQRCPFGQPMALFTARLTVSDLPSPRERHDRSLLLTLKPVNNSFKFPLGALDLFHLSARILRSLPPAPFAGTPYYTCISDGVHAEVYEISYLEPAQSSCPIVHNLLAYPAMIS